MAGGLIDALREDYARDPNFGWKLAGWGAGIGAAAYAGARAENALHHALEVPPKSARKAQIASGRDASGRFARKPKAPPPSSLAKFATSAGKAAGKLGTRVGKAVQAAAPTLGQVGRVAGLASGAVTVGALGLVAYNAVTGKHAGADPAEVTSRPNDPGRLATSGIAASTIGGAAARLIGPAAAAAGLGTAAGIAARFTPIGLGALAGYGAYEGYAKHGVVGGVRGALGALTFGLSNGVVDRALEAYQPGSSGMFKPGGPDASDAGRYMRDRIGPSLQDFGSKLNERMHGKTGGDKPWWRPMSAPGGAGSGNVRGGAYLDAGSRKAEAKPAVYAGRGSTPAAQPSKVASYTRTYTKGAKAGLTETVSMRAA